MRSLPFVILTVLLINCKGNRKTDEINSVRNEKKQDILEISPEKEKQIDIITGTAEQINFATFIEVSGYIKNYPNSLATVMAPFPGYIKRVYVHSGNHVNRGEKLVTLENILYLQIQEEYLETKANYEYVFEDYKRQGELTIENATSMKRWQQAKRDYEIQEARLYALREKIRLMGLNADSLEAKNISAQIILRAPISGRINHMNANLGKYCGLDDEIVEIASNSKLYAHLEIHEKDAYKIRKGQKVELFTETLDTITGSINAVTYAINEINRTVTAHADLETNDFIPGTYINARIYIKNILAYALSESAIVREGSEAYVFIKMDSEGTYRREKIKLGIESDGYWSVDSSGEVLRKKNLVLKGAYYLNAEYHAED